MKRIVRYTWLLLMSAMFAGCIGTDIVEEVIVGEQITITSRIQSLAVGESFQYDADFFDELGERVSSDIVWSSSDDQLVSITSSGLATANAPGDVFIRAISGSIRDSLMLTAGTTTTFRASEREGTFRGLRNYTVSGAFTLTENGENLELTFSSNFVASRGPGLFVFLSNSPTRTTGGIEVGRLQSNSGTQTYVISRDNAQLDTYNHVVIYCKPFGVAFGTGEFED